MNIPRLQLIGDRGQTLKRVINNIVVSPYPQVPFRLVQLPVVKQSLKILNIKFQKYTVYKFKIACHFE